jgi:UPF0042 nucleotide-binding protein
MTDIVVVTGLSGAGRSQVADDLEDLGWFVVDNLPVVLLDKVVELTGTAGGEVERLCLVVGIAREQASVLDKIQGLRSAGHRVRTVFMEASTARLVRRYETTRRRHPFADTGAGLESLIESERRALAEVRASADLIIDTTDLTVHQLRAQVVGLFGSDDPAASLAVTVMSFGFKHGLPRDVDMVLDIRFLPNPYWDEELRPLTGLDDKVREHVLSRPVAEGWVDRVTDLLGYVIPQCVAEGRSYLTVAVGCTGGRHRSVAVVEELARRLAEQGHRLRVAHRDIAAN